MSKDASTVSTEPPRRMRPESTYLRWEAAEGIPIYRGSAIDDTLHLEVAPWPRTGQKGAFINLADQEEDDAYILEIQPGQQTELFHHIFEAGIVILAGHGATSFWQSTGPKQTVEWQPGSLFAPPLNCHYQHFNLDGTDPARLLVITNAPMVMNLFRSSDFVFSDSYVFADRYDGQEDYFADHGDDAGSAAADAPSNGAYSDQYIWKTNFVPDL